MGKGRSRASLKVIAIVHANTVNIPQRRPDTVPRKPCERRSGRPFSMGRLASRHAPRPPFTSHVHLLVAQPCAARSAARTDRAPVAQIDDQRQGLVARQVLGRLGQRAQAAHCAIRRRGRRLELVGLAHVDQHTHFSRLMSCTASAVRRDRAATALAGAAWATQAGCTRQGRAPRIQHPVLHAGIDSRCGARFAQQACRRASDYRIAPLAAGRHRGLVPAARPSAHTGNCRAHRLLHPQDPTCSSSSSSATANPPGTSRTASPAGPTCELTETGVAQATPVGPACSRKPAYEFDVAYTSVLKRAVWTLWHCLDTDGPHLVADRQ